MVVSSTYKKCPTTAAWAGANGPKQYREVGVTVQLMFSPWDPSRNVKTNLNPFQHPWCFLFDPFFVHWYKIWYQRTLWYIIILLYWCLGGATEAIPTPTACTFIQTEGPYEPGPTVDHQVIDDACWHVWIDAGYRLKAVHGGPIQFKVHVHCVRRSIPHP